MSGVGGEGCVVRFTVSFIPVCSIVSPPFSSKASRTMLLNALGGVCEADEAKSMLAKRSVKPIHVSPVYAVRQGVKVYLYKAVGGGPSQPIVLREGATYGFDVTCLDGLDLSLMLRALTPGVKLPLFTGSVQVENLSVEAKRLELMNLDGRYIRMSFNTPVLLSFPRGWIGIQTPLRHSLFPIPCLIVWSLASHWNKYAPDALKVANPKRLAAYSNYALVEVDHRIKPVTAIYDEERRPRGFTGWVVYEHRKLKPKLSRRISQLMEYANYVGIGRSRAIGFGITEVRPLDQALH